MSNRIYLAAPWIDRELMEDRAKKFEALGFTITHKWWRYEGAGEEHEKLEFLRQCAIDDVNGVATADVVLVYNTSKSEGKAVEQGIAIAKQIPIFIIGKRGEVSKNVFHYLPLYVWVATEEEALEAIGG